MEERDLVQKILQGDREAEETFFQENARRLYPVCVHILGFEDSDADDVVQETFIIAFRKLGEFEFKSSLYTWLNHICANLCFERLRKRKRMLVSLEEDLERITLGKAGAAHDARALEEEKQSRVDFLQRHIRSMSQRCREVLELRDLRGESYIDVARALKIPPGTVMSQLARCRKALRHLVESELKGTKN